VLAGWVIGVLLLGLLFWLEPHVVRWMRRFDRRAQTGLLFVFSLGVILLGGLVITLASRPFVLPAAWVQQALAVAPNEPLAPFALEGLITTMASLFGLVAGALAFNARGGFDAGGPWRQRIVRFLVGLIGVLIFWRGLDVVFDLLAREGTLLAYALRYVRYTLVGVWITAWGPWVFVRLKLAKSS
jgi:hypothetical protein